MAKVGLYSTKEAYQQIGRCRNTILRWISDGLIADVEERDDNNYRLWTNADIERFIEFKNALDEEKRKERKVTANG